MPRTAVPSVRRRLLINLLVGFVLCWLSVAALTYHLSLKQVNRLFDDDMVDFGEAALRLLDLATEDQASEDGSITRSSNAAARRSRACPCCAAKAPSATPCGATASRCCRASTCRRRSRPRAPASAPWKPRAPTGGCSS